MFLGTRNKRIGGSVQFLGLALRADQDDAGHALSLNSLHIPTSPDGFLRARQAMVAVPAAPFARRANGMECTRDVQRDPLRCFQCAQIHLRHSWVAIYAQLAQNNSWVVGPCATSLAAITTTPIVTRLPSKNLTLL